MGLYFIGWSIRKWKIAAYLQLAKNWNSSSKVWQNLLFLSTFPTSLRFYAKGNWKSGVCKVCGVNFEFIESLKNNGTKYLLIFDDSCEKICNSKAFVDIATAGRHRALSTNYIKHNFFSPEQTRKRRWVTKHTHCSLQVSPWRNASNYS